MATNKLDDNSIMPSGIHQGKTLEQVPAHYLIAKYNSGELSEELELYVTDNMDVLEYEINQLTSK